TASNPPWILGCSVLTRPSIISGTRVTSETSMTFSPASRKSFAVPPVDTISMPCASSAVANSAKPVLSLTEMSARLMVRVSMDTSCPALSRHPETTGAAVNGPWVAGSSPAMTSSLSCRRRVVRVDQGMGRAVGAHLLDVPHDPDLVGLAHHPAEHDLGAGLRPARIGEEVAFFDRRLRRIRGDAPGLAVPEQEIHALPVLGNGRLHARVEMEADGIGAGYQPLGARQALGRGKFVLARDQLAGLRDQKLPRMHHAVTREIALVRALDAEIVAL